MDCDGGRAEGQRAVEDGEETVAAFRAVVHAAAELDCQRDVQRQGVAHSGDNRQRRGRLAHQVAAAAAAEDFLHRAGEVQVDRVEARGDQFAGGLSELLRVVAHQLAPQGWLLSPTRRNRRAFGPLVTLTTNWSRRTSQSV